MYNFFSLFFQSVFAFEFGESYEENGWDVYDAVAEFKRQVIYCYLFLSVSSSEARSSRITFFLSPDFHELWCSVISACLFTEGKRQWATLVLGLVTASVHYSCL